MLNEIEKIKKYVGDDNVQYETVIEVENTDNPDVKTLNLKSGTWSGKEPWFVIDENQKLHTMISIDSINKLINNFKQLQQDNFELKLEKTILQHVPIDYQDVWVVAMDEIKKIAIKKGNEKTLNIDLEKLLRKIKKEHPNLFLNLKDLFANQITQ
ncbi:MAG: DUF2603 domain-containing protein [Campylobacteraceae bacterium]|nr:DUF2603 domain-containing protein [Campylobacteraceae bacterium]